MSGAGDRSARRRFALVSVGLLVFILLDLALFAWLILRSISEREIQRVLLETRAEAEDLAQRIAEGAARGDDLYTVVAVEKEVQRYVDSVLTDREVVRTFEIRDKDGVLVMRRTDEIPVVSAEDRLVESSREVPSRREETTESTSEPLTYDLELPGGAALDVPIGELGSLHIELDRFELARRVSTLRAELVRNIGLIALLTLVVLGLSYGVIWRLWWRGRRFEEQAREAERLAYVGTLASGLAHEIRNPLNSLSLNMQLLEEELAAAPGDDPRTRLVSMTREEIGRLERLVTDFLAYARPRRLEFEAVPAVALLERCRALLHAEALDRGAELTVEDLTAGRRVRVDVNQFGQLLINLVQNGVAAAREAGRVPVIRLRAVGGGDEVVLEVTDNGGGIEPGEQAKIFDLFYSSRKGGTGLGLAIVRRIADAHGVRLELDSTPGVGTTVRLSLPALPDEEEARAGRAALELPATR